MLSNIYDFYVCAVENNDDHEKLMADAFKIPCMLNWKLEYHEMFKNKIVLCIL